MTDRIQAGSTAPGAGRRTLKGVVQANAHRLLRFAGRCTRLGLSLCGVPPRTPGLASVAEEAALAELQLASRTSHQDIHIIHEVAVHNEYRLPDRFAPGDVVIDIGTHIGSFSYAALRRGCREVYTFEADKRNFECATENLKAFGRCVRLHHKAVWRSDRPDDVLHASGYHEGNSGGVNVFLSESGPRLESVALDDVLRQVTKDGKRHIRLMKIDCEGSEYPILLTSKMLHLIDAMCGEFHELNDGVYDHTPIPAVAKVGGREKYTIGDLVQCLEAAGFRVEWQRKGASSIGLFFATR